MKELTQCEIEIRLSPRLSTASQIFDDVKMGAAVKNFRMDIGANQKLLAAEMGISQAYLCDLECGRRKWSARLYEKMRDGFDKIVK